MTPVTRRLLLVATVIGVAAVIKEDLLLMVTNFVNRSDATGELGENAWSGTCGP